MRKLKVLWLSNKVFEKEDHGATGTWLDAMSGGLVGSGLIELGNISTGRVKNLVSSDYEQIKQWIIPFSNKVGKDGFPNTRSRDLYISIIRQFKPDLIHVWGTETYAGLITAKKMIDVPALLDLQGSVGPISRIFHGDLSVKEQLSCIGLKEVLMHSSIFQRKNQYARWTPFENEIISNHEYISVQSTWTEGNVRCVNNHASIFHNERVLREVFYNCRQWSFSGDPVIFTMSAYASPFKGMHVIIRAVEILKKFFPNIQLKIGGEHRMKGLRKDGYLSWIGNKIRQAGLSKNVTWLNPLDGERIVEELLKSSVVVLPSYIESYGLALAESMAVGIPSVCSFNGGYSYLGENEKTTLFFTPGDHVMCAYNILRILTNKELAESLSDLSRFRALCRHDKGRIIRHQIKIYNEILQNN